MINMNSTKKNITELVVIEAAKRVENPERLEDIKFEEEFIKRCVLELEAAQKVRKNLDTTSFIMGFVSGAKISSEIQVENIKEK